MKQFHMKKHVLLVLRTLVAIGGIAFIIAKVNLTDQVVVPAGTRLPNGTVLKSEADFKVVQGRYDPMNPTGELLIEIADSSQKPQTLSIPFAALNTKTEEKGLRFLPGLISMVRMANTAQLWLGLLAVGMLYPIVSVRWWWLMRASGIIVPLWKAFRLTMVGSFFNLCMPGTTGGDVIKAYYAAKGSNRRADAVVTVVVDRGCGLLGLLILASLAGLFMRHDEMARKLTYSIWSIGLVIAIAGTIYFSQNLRRGLGVEWLLANLPAQRFLAPIDQAVFAYRNHKRVVLGAILISVMVHIILVGSSILAGYALGIRSPIGLMLVVIPVTFLVAAIPISPPQGIGVMEFFALVMLTPPLAYPNQILGMLIFIRLYQIFYSLLGSMFLLKTDIHLHPQNPPQQ